MNFDLDNNLADFLFRKHVKARKTFLHNEVHYYIIKLPFVPRNSFQFLYYKYMIDDGIARIKLLNRFL